MYQVYMATNNNNNSDNNNYDGDTGIIIIIIIISSYSAFSKSVRLLLPLPLAYLMLFKFLRTNFRRSLTSLSYNYIYLIFLIQKKVRKLVLLCYTTIVICIDKAKQGVVSSF